jgi:hypothetical protein
MSINLNSSRSNVYRTTGAGIQEYGNELQVQISPNPSNGIFMIKMEDVRGQMANGKIEIYNTMGEKVYSSTMSKEQLTINLGEVNSGIYFLNVKTDGGTTVKKIIKE